jgi:hypothetical protein
MGCCNALKKQDYLIFRRQWVCVLQGKNSDILENCNVDAQEKVEWEGFYKSY